MLDKILSLTKQFVSIKSKFDNQVALDEILRLAQANLQEFTIERFERNGVKSVLVYNSPTRPKKFKIILNGHLDIIPGKDEQYNVTLKDDKLYGVGAMDMKAGVACLIFAFKEVANRIDYPIGLQLVTDEELGGFNGTKYQIEEGVRADFVISGETTNLRILNKTKGVLQVQITCKGVTAHGAYPWRGENAVWKMNKFLNILNEAFPSPSSEQWTTTVNLSRIGTSNNSYNKIPDDCTIWLDIRFIPEDTEIVLEKIKKLLPNEFRMEVLVNEPALFVAENNKYLKKLQQTAKKVTNKDVITYSAHGSTDARHYMHVNTPGIDFGPIGGNIGADDEWVNIPSLLTFYTVLTSFLLSLQENKSL
jgi:succinyl-diaminopimelate desuccinylase